MRLLVLGLLVAALPGCLPYAVGSTARTHPPGGAPLIATTLQFIPGGNQFDDDDGHEDEASFVINYPQADLDLRLGLDERSDAGVRFVGGTGFVVNYKRRVAGADPLGAGVAVMGGGGVVNGGNHAHLEATLIVSGSEYGPATLFGGLRAMQVIPLNEVAVSDSPTLGGFIGLQLGSRGLRMLPEVGVFYDPSALDLRESNWIVVPSLTLHVADLF